jgi:4-hydroxybenzoate polyprenyltransferase
VLLNSITNLRRVLEMIRFSHTLFALPVALTSMLVAARGFPGLSRFLLILAAMVTARTTAMAFNRIVDLDYDRLNPRTAERHLPKGRLSIRFAALFTAVFGCLFVLVCYLVNPLAYALSPLALAIILLYSYTKRFTSLSHLVLGLSLSLAPVGAWIAVTGAFHWVPFLLAAFVLLWVAAFDIIYSILDLDFDRKHGLHSVVARRGIAGGLTIVRFCHLAALALLVLFGRFAGLGTLYFAGTAIAALLLTAENVIVVKSNLGEKRINTAFFHLNSAVAIVLLLFTAADIFL